MTLFHVVARYRTNPDATQDVLGLLEEMAKATRKEAGNLPTTFTKPSKTNDRS